MYTRALRLMYIAETLINPLFTDVTFRRDSEGDGSSHYESGGVMSPVPSAICAPDWQHNSRNPKTLRNLQFSIFNILASS